ncbi:T9SS type A sorting domain-containing protein [Portibacter lacus]|uniref:Secretion system C-terminal sorting domain-containing protein n=1 Tax=Portibacter lacus TaxID=1099794 RepID=A0AA37WFG0_9BACT|nr:T9SS type A sorting domain-containing protein [Portibacter lacus]GLR16935.1 hypothetical protein GCM10007940_15500 [Portibacter lacus]
MIFRILHFLLLFIGFSIGLVNGQIDQVSVGEGYSNQAYYSLSTGEVTVLSNEAWDIAFTNQGGTDAGILINESSTSGSEAIGLFLTAETDWNVEIVDEGQFPDSIKIYNSEQNWSEGAFNSVKDTSSVLDFGWGLYNPSNHVIEGNRIFVIKKRDGVLLKFQVESLSSGTYTFKYAHLDGSNEQVKTVSKNSELDNSLILFSLNTGETLDMPTDFDLIFQRYTTDLDAGDGTIIPYTVTGVLSGPGVEVAKAEGVDPENVLEADYADQYSNSLTAIGHDWKGFDFALGWVIPDDRAYFVKNSKGEKYKIVFYDFEGSSTGTTTLEKTVLLSSAISTIDNSNIDIKVYPNPFTHSVIVSTGSDNDAEVQLYDIEGKLLLSKNFNRQIKLETENLISGQYLLKISQDDHFITKQIIK